MTITILFVIFQPNANSSAALLQKTFTLFLGNWGYINEERRQIKQISQCHTAR